MSPASASTPEKITSEKLVAIEIELKAEAAAIERLRKQLSEAGAGASKDLMADFAKRQKAFLDRKIVFEKQKRTLGEAPPPQPKAPEKTPTPPPQKVAPRTPAPVKPPTKPAEAPKPKAPAEKAPEIKKPEIKKPEEKKVVKKPVEPAVKRTPVPPKPAPQRKREVPLLDDEDDDASDEGGGITPLGWLLIAAIVSAVIWYFVSR